MAEAGSRLWAVSGSRPKPGGSRLRARPCVGRGFSPANGGPSASAPSSSVPAPETPSQTPVINALLNGITVIPVRNSRLVDLNYTSTDPQFAALAANAIAKAYIAQTLEYKFLSSKDASDWLGQQLTEQRKQVEASE